MSRGNPTLLLSDDPLWYKDAIIYELRVRAFADSNGDGIGDFQGLTSKLDYLQDLGVSAIWLLPFYPSPLRDDGYDISSFTEVHPQIGTLADFRAFLRAAHARGLRVITELVLNHTSDQHPWFQRARRAKPGSRYRDWYVWNDSPDKYADARIIFQDTETSNWSWDPIAGAYYWHRFFSNQPDLNYDNPVVRKEMLRVLDFWLDMGVDGMRLDAVPYLFEEDGTNCENLPATHDYLRNLRAHMDGKYKNRMFLAEANQWPEDAVAYFGKGDEANMNFHFPIMPRMFMSIQREERTPIIDILDETPEIPESCQWALFLRNHDELTLEMVTDEERDYMYRSFAADLHARLNLGIRRRLAPLLGNNRRKIELMNGLLFSLPGTPVIYYGDEIGMGDNFYLGDRNGVRTPMQWSSDRNAGFSRANPQLLYLPVIIDPEYHFETINVETQQNNPQSLLWWVKRLIALRNRYPAFGRGSLRFLSPANPKVLAFVRKWEGQTLLVVANLSRFVQFVELDLQEFGGSTPLEMMGHTRFPPIGDLPYLLTLGPHEFYWFELLPPEDAAEGAELDLPELTVRGAWTDLVRGKSREALERMLPAYLRRQRWFGGKARTVRFARLAEVLPLPSSAAAEVLLCLVQVDYNDGTPEMYQLPLSVLEPHDAEGALYHAPQAGLALVQTGEGERVLVDATADKRLGELLLGALLRRRTTRAGNGALHAVPSAALRGAGLDAEALPDARLLSAEQSNSNLLYGEQAILKLFRKVEPGTNPDLELGAFLTERGRYPHTPAVLGHLEYRGVGEPSALGILHEFVPNNGDAWSFTLDELYRYLERVQTGPQSEPPPVSAHVMDSLEEPPDESELRLLGAYLESARLLGQRTAELHLALASAPAQEDFAPQAFSSLYQRSLYQSFSSQVSGALGLLRRRMGDLPEAAQELARDLMGQERALKARFRAIVGHRMDAQCIRTHGDLHLGQVLYTGRDFQIIDFEGEPARPLSERRIKRSPLRDVAGMLRSFDYAAQTALHVHLGGEAAGVAEVERLSPWTRFWERRVSAAFLQSYFALAGDAAYLPGDARDRAVLLDVFLLEKVLYELGYELNNRPNWVLVPLQGLTALLEAGPASAS